MQLILISSFLAVLIFCFPESFQSQDSNYIIKNRKTERITKEKKLSNKSILKSVTRKLQAKKIVEEFVDGVFIERNVVQTFERLTRFEVCSDQDRAIDQVGKCLLKETPSEFGDKTNSRLAAAIWRYAFGAIFLILGSEPIPKDNESYPYASSVYDDLKAAVSKKYGFSEQFVGDENNKEDVEKRLDEIENNYTDLENTIFEGIDKSLYEKNIKTMKKSIKVKKAIIKKRTYYGVSWNCPVFSFVLAVRKGEMKIIGLVDGI